MEIKDAAVEFPHISNAKSISGEQILFQNTGYVQDQCSPTLEKRTVRGFLVGV